MTHDVLAPIPLFAKLPVQERAELAGMLQTKQFDAHQPVVWLGEQGDDFYIVHTGKVAVSCPDESGKEVTLGTLGPGQFFGEISLLDGGPRTATVRTLRDSTMLILARDDFLQFLKRHPDAAIYMLTILGQRQRETNEKLRGIRNANEEIEAKRTPVQRAAAKIAAIGASEFFVLTNVAFFVTWIIVNTLRHGDKIVWHDNPPTFFFLGFIITMEAILLSMFVLNSQKQQAERDRIKADLDYQVNLKAHQEVMQLQQKVDRLYAVVAGQAGTGGSSEQAG